MTLATDVHASARRLHGDQRGAIMLMGLCMACFLIGALWFVIGMGDAIVFRDTMQEATDSAAFTTAVIHAKGMNFIAALNIIILVLVAVYILMGLLHDVLFYLCLRAGWATLGLACIPWAEYRPYYTGYASFMKTSVDVLHYVEVIASFGYPAYGTYKGWKVGREYGQFGPVKRDLNIVPLSTSIVPGFAINGAMNRAIQSLADARVDADGRPVAGSGGTPAPSSFTSPAKKMGLPVEAKPWNSVCGKLTSMVLRWFWRGIPDMVRNWISAGVQFRYCNALGADDGSAELAADFRSRMNDGASRVDDANTSRAIDNARHPDRPPGELGPPISVDGRPAIGEHAPPGNGILNQVGIDVRIGSNGGGLDPGFDRWWGKDGPLVPYGGTANGSPWQQIWAVNFMPEYKDPSEHRVAIGARKRLVEQPAKPWFYVSQAEFYFDCQEGWGDASCNGEDNAGYSLRWRARLRRVSLPAVTTMLATFGGELLRNMVGYGAVKQEITNAITGGTATGSVILGTVISSGFGAVESSLGRPIADAAGNLDRTVNDAFTDYFGVYH